MSESRRLAVCRRAAARCNKGVEVLLAVALEHFVLVVVRVLRGPTQADESAKKLRKLVHCQWCEERVFLKQGHMVDGESGTCSAASFCHTGALALVQIIIKIQHETTRHLGRKDI